MKKKLEEIIKKYDEGIPYMSDYLYDQMEKSYTEDEVREAEKKVRKRQLGSLKKIKLEDVEKWVRERFIPLGVGSVPAGFKLFEKIDGVAIQVQYEKGRLVRISTRSRDITDKKELARFPFRTYMKYVTTIRCEAVLPYEYCEDKPDTLRSKCAGILHRKDLKCVEDLHFVIFDYQSYEDDCYEEHDGYKDFTHEKIHPCGCWRLSQMSVEGVVKDLKEAFIECENDKDMFPTDGVVLSFGYNHSFFDYIEFEDSPYPNNAVAIKFSNVEAKTYVIDVIWSTGKKGSVTPVLIVHFVNIGGTMISHVNLQSLHQFNEWKLSEGVDVIICKAGGIIPKLVSVIPDTGWGEVFKAPTTCSDCAGDLTVVGKKLMCFICKETNNE